MAPASGSTRYPVEPSRITSSGSHGRRTTSGERPQAIASSNGDRLVELMAKQVHATGETSKAGGELLLEVSTIEPVR